MATVSQSYANLHEKPKYDPYKLEYPEVVYQKADSAFMPTKYKYNGPSREDLYASRAYTPMIIKILNEELAEPLKKIPNFHEHLTNGTLDSETIGKVEKIIDRFFSFIPNKEPARLKAFEELRSDTRKRSLNIMSTFFQPQLRDLTRFLVITRSWTQEEAVAHLAMDQNGSMVDGIGFEADRQIAEKEAVHLSVAWLSFLEKIKKS